MPDVLSAGPPHILLIVLDAARRDAVAPYRRDVVTPTLGALAARGVAVDSAQATAPWTLPSHVAMFTGQMAGRFGLDQAPGGDPRSVRAALEPLRDRLLAVHLSAAGYRTHGMSANLWVSPHSGLDAGFDSFHYAASPRLEGAFTNGGGRGRARLLWAREGLRSRADDGARSLGASLSATIAAADPSQPHFFFANLVEAHSPYLPPIPFNDLGARDRIGAALDCAGLLSFESICRAAAGALDVPAPVLSRLAHLHRCAVAQMDAWIAGALAHLRRRGMLERTLVIVAADHGEAFGEDGLLAHGFGLIDPLIRVPLIAAGPGAGALANRPGAVSLRELAPLIATAAGIDPAPFTPDAGDPGDGIALARSAPICPADDPRMLAFAERWSLSQAQVRRLTADRWRASDGSHTLHWVDGIESATPGASPSALVPLRDALSRARAASATPLDEPGPPPPSPEGVPGAEEDPAVAELERQMKLLGYM